MVILGIWYSGAPDSLPMLQRIGERYPVQAESVRKFRAEPPVRMTPSNADGGLTHLDGLWGYFMATGDEAPVIRVIETLKWASIRGDIRKLAVGGAARWSLTSNAVQHSRVLEICKAQVPLQPPAVASVLREVIAKAEARLAEPKKRAP